MTKTTYETPADLIDAVGDSYGPTDWIEITQERINTFADATDDHQWIHVDVERTKAGPFGAPIAHGYLTLSLCARFLSELCAVKQAAMGINYGVNKARFPRARARGVTHTGAGGARRGDRGRRRCADRRPGDGGDRGLREARGRRRDGEPLPQLTERRWSVGLV